MDILTPPQLKEKRPPGRQAKHTEAYQLMVAKALVDGGMSYREASKLYGLSHGSISNIIKKYKHHRFKAKRRETKGKHNDKVEEFRHESRIRDLKLEIADLFLENLMLKKMLELSISKNAESSSPITSENLDQWKKDAK